MLDRNIESMRHSTQHGLLKMVSWFLSEHPIRAIVAVLLFLLSGVSESFGIIMVLPLLETLLSDGGLGQSWISSLVATIFELSGYEPSTIGVVILMVSLMALKFSFTLSATMIIGFFTADISARVRTGLVGALFSARWELFSREKTSDFVQAISNDAGKTADSGLAISNFCAKSLQVLFLIIATFALDWMFASSAVIVGAVILSISVWPIRLAKRAATRQVSNTRGLAKTMIDVLSVMRVVKAMSREKYILPRVEGFIFRLKSNQIWGVFSNELLRLLPEFLAVVALSISIAFLVPTAALDPKVFLSFCFLFVRILQSLTQVQALYKNLQTGQPAFWFVMNLYKATSTYSETPCGDVNVPQWQTIILDNVSFGYDETYVLREVNLTINRGEFVTLVGQSGSGKTTAINLLIGLLEPTVGRVMVDDIDLIALNRAQWRSRIGYLPQDCVLYAGTLFENITLGDPSITEEAVWVSLQRAGATEFVKKLSHGLDQQVGEKGDFFSGGQRQRLALARALVGQPEILILDEATSALDEDSEREICRQLQNLSKDHEYPITIIAISHRSALAKVADQVYTVRDGELMTCSLS
ncbi:MULTISPECIES: ABC transporter ATP-binding protein [Thalassospira]|uniref:ABC transporter ATP-binding protein n=2 Tax=Thalassospira TaxID=168934 RepID=A0A367WEC9_9PROT|nr:MULTISPECIES: ABC transporter ATP-binding protein [Thalassospira]MDG4717680.1 ABC transporter ATP-binding protein [Thalassospira sp. FZY0004]RCK38862.1 hypothetical protein TH19_03425 [Thalassospira profundimaris]